MLVCGTAAGLAAAAVAVWGCIVGELAAGV